MSWTVYFNVEPSDRRVDCMLYSDHGEICAANGQQHVDIVCPDSMPQGWGARLTVGCDGYQTASYRVNAKAPALYLEDGSQLAVVLVPDVPEPIPPTPTPSGDFIRVNGINLVDGSGRPWLYAGYHIQMMLARMVNDGADPIPVFQEAMRYGFNTGVVFGHVGGQWYEDNGFSLDSRRQEWSSWLATFLDLAASVGFRIDLRVLQGAGNLSDGEKQDAWRKAKDVCRGRWNVFPLSPGNESNVNSWDPFAFPAEDLGGVLFCRGTQGEGNPPAQPPWNVTMWEPRQGNTPIFKILDDSGAGLLELQHGYVDGYTGQYIGPFPVPLLIGEAKFFNDVSPDLYGDDRWTDPQLAADLGANVAGNCPGGATGTSNSCIGYLNNPGGLAEQCMVAFMRALRGTFNARWGL